MTLDEYFEAIYVINLARRRDRRRQMEAELARAGLRAQFFNAVQTSEQGDWPSVGARGCFMSHYAVLQRARDAGLRNVLILEDDVDFVPRMPALGAELVKLVTGTPWGFLYAGHNEAVAADHGQELQMLPWQGGLVTAHFYAVSGAVLPSLLAFLEQVQSRPSGHPLGGRQHIDGAYSMFRAQHPEISTLIASPVLGCQRSSRSDISSSWPDKVPAVGSLIEMLRKLRRKVSRRI